MKLIHKVKKPTAFVFNYLTEMQKFVSVHPVIYKIESLEGDEYLVYEKLKFGFIPYSFTYKVTVEGNAELSTVVIKATVMKLVNIEMIFELKPEGENCIVNETINFKTILPVVSLMTKIFKEQHTRLFMNIGEVK